jgi:hypothetical protein
MADTGGPTREPELEERVGRLEADVADIKATLYRLAPLIDQLYGSLTATLSNLATKADLSDLRTELKSEIAELRLDVVQRPTRRLTVFDIFAIVGLIGAILTIAARFAR